MASVLIWYDFLTYEKFTSGNVFIFLRTIDFASNEILFCMKEYKLSIKYKIDIIC